MRSESCSFIWHPKVRSRYLPSLRGCARFRLDSAPEPPRSLTALRLPGRRGLLRVLDRARLPHHGDLDLSGVLELLLDLLGDVARHDLRGQVVHVLRLDHHPDLAAGLHRVDLLHARVARADLLQALEPLDVGLQALAPRPRPAARDPVGDLRDHRLDRSLLDLAVVRLDAVDDLWGLLHPPGDLGPDDRVRALDLVGDRLADVVQVRDAGVERRLLAGPADLLVDLLLGALERLLDPGGMDPPILHELLEREPRRLAADGVEARQDDRLRRVVDDEVHAGRRLERADVPALASDDPALHVLAR